MFDCIEEKINTSNTVTELKDLEQEVWRIRRSTPRASEFYLSGLMLELIWQKILVQSSLT